jgi:cholesterol transport system auxiliary component
MGRRARARLHQAAGARRGLLALWAAAALSACAVVQPPARPVQHIFVLDAEIAVPAEAAAAAPTIIVTPPRTAPGFDTERIAYVPRRNELSYYAQSRWADTPSRMLEPLLVRALEGTGGFRAVVQGASPAPGDLRLDTDILRLQHEFLEKPSRVRVTVRAQLTDLRQRSVLATRTFDVVEPAETDDAHGGTAAANRAVSKVLREVATLAAAQAGRVR